METIEHDLHYSVPFTGRIISLRDMDRININMENAGFNRIMDLQQLPDIQPDLFDIVLIIGYGIDEQDSDVFIPLWFKRIRADFLPVGKLAS